MEIIECKFYTFIKLDPGAMPMNDSSYRLNFDLGKKNKIHHHS
jgi:hypothetical protein